MVREGLAVLGDVYPRRTLTAQLQCRAIPQTITLEFIKIHAVEMCVWLVQWERSSSYSVRAKFVFQLHQQFYGAFNLISNTNLHRICVPYGYNRLFHSALIFVPQIHMGFSSDARFSLAFIQNLGMEFLFLFYYPIRIFRNMYATFFINHITLSFN
jgi:hypothetical protein